MDLHAEIMNVEALYTSDKFGKPLHFNLYEEGFDDAKKICAVKAQAKLQKLEHLLQEVFNDSGFRNLDEALQEKIWESL